MLTHPTLPDLAFSSLRKSDVALITRYLDESYSALICLLVRPLPVIIYVVPVSEKINFWTLSNQCLVHLGPKGNKRSVCTVEPPKISPFVLRVLRLLGQRVVVRRDSGVMENFWIGCWLTVHCTNLRTLNCRIPESLLANPHWPRSLRTLGMQLFIMKTPE